jgi:hypothetical protein
MLKKYTKYAATAFAVASSSTFMIGCGEAKDTGPLEVIPEPTGPVGDEEGGEAPPDKGGKGDTPA